MKKFICGLVAVMTCLGLSGCSSKGDSGAPKEKVYLKESEIAEMYTAPKKFKGKYVELVGKVFSTPEVEGNEVAFQMWGNPEKSENNTVVSAINPEGGLKEGDYVKVVGYVHDEYNGKNAFGGSVIAPMIVAETLEVTDYKTAVMPTVKEITPNISLDQHGATVTVTKVEFAAQETRVYVKVENNTGNKFSFYSFNTKIVQNGKQFEEQSNYNAEYPEVSSSILSGVTSEGIIAFPAIEQANFTFITEGRSDNYSLDFTDYTFEIAVQ